MLFCQRTFMSSVTVKYVQENLCDVVNSNDHMGGGILNFLLFICSGFGIPMNSAFHTSLSIFTDTLSRKLYQDSGEIL